MIPVATGFSEHDAINLAYVVGAILFIVGLRGLTSPRTAQRGNMIAAVGMIIAVVATLFQEEVQDYGWIIAGGVFGSVIGVYSARAVKMTAMPQMVALFNGVGGGAAALIALSEYHRYLPLGGLTTDIEVAMLLSLIIGSISFWGSVIAFLKLQELMKGSPTLPGQSYINAALAAVAVGGAAYMIGPGDEFWLPVSIAVVAAVVGIFVVLPIGGADMPVVISTLNAMTGLAASATGFALNNTMLIIAGTLVGASGTILTRLMATSMNRSIGNVLFGSFGAGSSAAAAAGPGAAAQGGTVRSTTAADVAILLSYASNVIVVPGYGLAVAQAQHTVRELAEELEKRGVNVRYAIHPVAGRMPGHMNVLLAEADVPYEQLVEMDDINPEFQRTNVVLVIGANDVTNPAAKSNPDSPIYGMPILEVDQAENVIVLKRSMNPGYAGIDNDLYYDPKTQMLFGDAKSSVADLVSEVKNV